MERESEGERERERGDLEALDGARLAA